VRLTLDVADVNQRIQRLWLALAGMAVVVLAVVALVGWVIARSVTSPLRRLNAAATRFADGDLRTEELPGTGPPELRELAATMSAMAARLDALLTSQRSFVADASHQLRTPLTALRLRLENVESGLDEPAAGEVAAAIEETRRLADLVNQLLLLARVDERPVLEPTDVGGLARDRVDTWGAVAQGSDVTLHLDAPDPVRPALAVRGAVEQVLDNLIDNALAVSSPDTTITIAVRDTDDAVELTVSDQGPGLPDDQKADALRRFWRGDTSTPGTGLGLAIVDRLIAASGGSLRLADAPGGGLQVMVRLPVAGSLPRAS
jgi:signal transduction histidine kinase